MRPGDIELHIEELFLDGLPSGDPERLREAVEAELTRLMTEGDTPSSLGRGGETAQLDGGAFDVAAGSGAEATGAQIARSVHRGLDR